MGNPLGILIGFLVPLLVVDTQSEDVGKLRNQIFWLMVIEGIPSVVIAVFTLLFWFKGKSRESIMILEGKIDRNTIIEDKFKTVSLSKQFLHILSRFNLVLMILTTWVHSGMLQSYSSQLPEIFHTFGLDPVNFFQKFKN